MADDFELYITTSRSARQELRTVTTNPKQSMKRKAAESTVRPARLAKRGRDERASRRHPVRINDQAYSAFHMSAEELSRDVTSSSKEEGKTEVISAEADEEKDNYGDGFGAFVRLGISERMARAVVSLGLKRPTRIQLSAAGLLAKSCDTLIVAPTGSGKTLAYLIPMLDSFAGACRRQGMRGLVVAPTRELCLQIASAASRLARVFDVGIVPGAIAGGERRKSEKARLRKGVTLVVATPGRLLDHLKLTASLRVEALEWFVLDEVDRLLDLGFAPRIDEISAAVGFAKRQNIRSVLVTATVDARLQELAANHLGRDHAVAVASDNAIPPPGLATRLCVVPAGLKLEYTIVTLKLRLAALAALLAAHADRRTLVFVSCCASADFHARIAATCFKRRGFDSLHGSMNRDARQAAYKAFCDDPAYPVLFATDIAARGLDFEAAQVDWVLHLDAPRDVGSYIHRSGRAARAGRSGRATLLLLPTERPLLDAIKSRDLPKLSRVALPSANLGNNDDAAATCRAFQAAVADDVELLDAARAAFVAHLRAYAAKADAKLVADACEKRHLDRAFRLRELHLGHAAKCFALADPPRTVARILSTGCRTAGAVTTTKDKKKVAKPAATRRALGSAC